MDEKGQPQQESQGQPTPQDWNSISSQLVDLAARVATAQSSSETPSKPASQ